MYPSSFQSIPPLLRAAATGLIALSLHAAEWIPPPALVGSTGFRPLAGVEAERLPGFGWVHPDPLPSLLPYGTTESVGDGAALLLYTPLEAPGSEAAIRLYEPLIRVSSNRNEYAESVGIRFWVKGDGSDGNGYVSLGIQTSAEVNFPLSTDTWREVRYSWSRLPFDFSRERPLDVLEVGIRIPRKEIQYVLLDEMGLISIHEDPDAPFPKPGERTNYHTLRPNDAGYILYNLQNKVPETQGIRFKYRGGGTTRRLRVHWEGASDRPHWLSLRNTRWQEDRILWKDLPPPQHRHTQHLVFRFDDSPARGHSFVIDRMELVADWNAGRAVSPTPGKDPPGKIDPSTFMARTEKIAPILDKLKTGKRICLAILGDALLAPSSRPALPPRPAPYLDTFGARLYPALTSHYRPVGSQLRFDLYEPATHSWKALGGSTPWSTGLTHALSILSDSNPHTVDAGIEHILTFSPDLAILQLGSFHILHSSPAAYREDLLRSIQTLKKQGILFAIATPPPVADLATDPISGSIPWERTLAFAEVARDVARSENCPLLDTFQAILSRGPVAAAALYQDRLHLNPQGHWLLTNFYATFLGIPNRFLWDDLPPPLAKPE